MKIYRCTTHDVDLGHVQSWHPNKVEATRELKRRQAERGESTGYEGVDLVNIPTDKAGLVRWLNLWFNTDNG